MKQNSALLLALDFGGTKITAASIRVANPARTTESVTSHTWLQKLVHYLDPTDTVVDSFSKMVEMGRLVSQKQPIAAIGVSFGGPVNHQTGIVAYSPHVQGWEAFPLQRKLEELFAVPVAIDNDGNCAAWGEFAQGSGMGVAHLLYVTVSTGVGGGWILNKRPYRGQGNMAGEIGHMVVDPGGPQCSCGKRGCVERFASGPFMAQDLAHELGLSPGEVDGKRVAELANQGDKIAQKILIRGADALGFAIGNAVNLMAPDRVVIGGGVSKSGEMWWTAVRKTAQKTVLPGIALDLVPAKFQDDAPLWGAINLAHSRI